MAVEATRVTVGTSAAQVYAAAGGPARIVVTIGYELTNGTSITLTLESGDEVFAIAGTAGHRVDVIRT